jgi:hypothetical protein
MKGGALLSATQLAAVQQVALSGMQSAVTVYRRTDSPVVADNAYGDDALTWVETSESRVADVKGWLYSTPNPVQETDTGAVVTVNTYRLYLPVGTDVEPGDRVVVGVEEFTVSDTTHETTWPALLSVSLRRRE